MDMDIAKRLISGAPYDEKIEFRAARNHDEKAGEAT